MILIDAETGIREQDKKIAGYAIDAGKAVMLVVNKWDTITKDTNTMNRWIKEIESHFQNSPVFLRPYLLISMRIFLRDIV